MKGFDAADVEGEWRAGDEVLFGLRLRRATGDRHWLLHVRLTEPVALARVGEQGAVLDPVPPIDWTLRVNGEPQRFRSASCRVLATVHDADGNVLGRSEPLLPREFLARGFGEACALVQQQRRVVRRAHDETVFYQDLDVRPFAEATVAAMAMLQVVQDDEVLAPLLWEVIEKPSVWSVVKNLGAKVVVRPRFHAAVETRSPVAVAVARAWRVPLALVVNEQPALATELLVVPSCVPFALAAGIVGALAKSPLHTDIEFSMLLLAARRGSAAPRIETAGKSQAAFGR